MKFLGALALAASLSTLVLTVGAIPKITRTGRYLYADDGTRFFVKGITYQTQGAFSCLFLFFYSSPLRSSSCRGKQGEEREERKEKKRKDTNPRNVNRTRNPRPGQPA
jgi:hypothetical protein